MVSSRFSIDFPRFFQSNSLDPKERTGGLHRLQHRPPDLAEKSPQGSSRSAPWLDILQTRWPTVVQWAGPLGRWNFGEMKEDFNRISTRFSHKDLYKLSLVVKRIQLCREYTGMMMIPCGRCSTLDAPGSFFVAGAVCCRHRQKSRWDLSKT